MKAIKAENRATPYIIRLQKEILREGSSMPSTPLSEIFSDSMPGTPILAGIRNNKMVSLNEPIGAYDSPVDLEPVLASSALGHQIYRSTLMLLLPYAVYSVDPEILKCLKIVKVSPNDGIICDIGSYSSQSNANAIASSLQDIVTQDLPISSDSIDFIQAQRHFINNPLYYFSVISSSKSNVKVYRIGEQWIAPKNGIVAPSTAYVPFFNVKIDDNKVHIIWPLPFSQEMNSIPPITSNVMGTQAFMPKHVVSRELTIQQINTDAESDASGFVLSCEREFNDKIIRIANEIVVRGARVVLMSGPSSSGKTTSSLKLAVELSRLGKRAVPIPLDNYYKRSTDCPVGLDGKPDFESPDALRLDLLQEHLAQLLNYETVRVPELDFITGTYFDGESITLENNSILIMEGIHGINPIITGGSVDTSQCYRIFMAPLNAIKGNINVSTSDLRLIRRVCRDKRTRGTDPEETLNMWSSVRRAEHTFIFPYSKSADFILNTALDYELSVLSPVLIEAMKPKCGEELSYLGKKLLRIASSFASIDTNIVPRDSIVREFIGNGMFNVK